tara:strand:+ start:7088 stop:8419 length:1332 start_codon:yes stop_codon:yes gene_type:complete
MANVVSNNAGAKNLGGSGVLYTDRRDFYIKPNVVKELWTDVTPFTTVIANQNTITGMSDPTFKMFEHRNPWVNQTITCGTAEANVAVSAESGFLEYSASSNVGGAGAHWEGLEVDIATSGDVLGQGVISVWTADANDDGTANDARIKIKVLNSYDAGGIDFADGSVLTVIGNAHGEGTGAPEAWSDDLSVVYNSTQIFKTPLEITGTLLEASLRGESKELARLRTMKSQEHKIQKERAFLFGANPKGISDGFSDIEALSDKNGKALRSTMGIVSALKKYGTSTDVDAQNVFASTEIDTYGEFVDAMEKIFQYVPTAGVKKAFVGPGALGYFSKQGGNAGSFAGDSGWTVNLGDMKRDSLGFNYRMLETPHGMLQLIPTPALRYNYNKHMLIVDEENLFHAQYRAPKFEASIQANDYDGVKDQYMSDEGIGISLLESHSLMVTP